MSKRTLKVKIHNIEVDPRWGDSTITVQEYHNGEPIKAVTIAIRHPGDLMDFRWRLDEIERYWKKQMGVQ